MGNKLTKSDNSSLVPKNLLGEIRSLIEETRSAVATTVNAGLTALYWRIGKRINEEILEGKRAGYGEEIVSTLSQQLSVEYGSGFAAKNLRHMLKFADTFPDKGIVSTLWRQLTWSHFKEIMYLKDPLQYEFYAAMCRRITRADRVVGTGQNIHPRG